jgi:hypothetical protein
MYDIGSRGNDTLALTTSENNGMTLFWLEGDRRQMATRITNLLHPLGFTVQLQQAKGEARSGDLPPAVQVYGVWPHLGRQAIEALDGQLDGMTVVDLRDPALVGGEPGLSLLAPKEPSDGEVDPASGESRAA